MHPQPLSVPTLLLSQSFFQHGIFILSRALLERWDRVRERRGGQFPSFPGRRQARSLAFVGSFGTCCHGRIRKTERPSVQVDTCYPQVTCKYLSKNFGRKPIFYTRSPAFSGGNILEPKQCLVAGEISSRRENCWQRSPPATSCRCGKQLSLPQKSEDVAVCGGGDKTKIKTTHKYNTTTFGDGSIVTNIKTSKSRQRCSGRPHGNTKRWYISYTSQ